jgi:hypothetical protein
VVATSTINTDGAWTITILAILSVIFCGVVMVAVTDDAEADKVEVEAFVVVPMDSFALICAQHLYQ